MMKKYPLLKQAYNYDDFDKSGTQLVKQLTSYLKTQQLPDSKANNWLKPTHELAYWKSYKFNDLNSFVEDLLDHSIHVHNPKYMGHQVSVPTPISIMGGIISNVLNNGSAVYEMGRASTTIEKCVTDLFCEYVGYGENSSGLMTSGGTLASLTALLAARQAMENSDYWKSGNSEKLAVMVSSQAHYCIDRAARVMGLGENGVVLVPINSEYNMDAQALERHYQKTISSGFKVIAIVGSACSTATGTYDDLNMIADFCTKNKVWFHVDGAHGGAVVFSNKYKPLVKGIERADSVIIDTHKMMMTPALSTVLLYKDKIKGASVFHQKAQYLFEDQNFNDQWYNGGLRTFECTKFMMSLKFYLVWKSFGVKIFEQNVDCLYEQGEIFAKLIDHNPNFELAINPQTNIVCFRRVKPDLTESQLNELNTTIRQNLLEDSEFYIVQAVLNKAVFLRVTLMNPMTNEKHLSELLNKIELIS